MTIYKKRYTKSQQATRSRKLVAQREPEKVDWEALRPEILKKSEGCYLCGKPLTLSDMTTDHVKIQPMGCKKNDSTGNLMPCCWDCNYFKGSRRLSEGQPCYCGQKYLVKGLKCLRCRRVGIENMNRMEQELTKRS